MPANPRLIGFLSGTAQDGAGRLLPDLLAWPDQRLEQVHDFIQWMFPLPEPSPVNPDAPVLDAGTIAEIRARAESRPTWASRWSACAVSTGTRTIGSRREITITCASLVF